MRKGLAALVLIPGFLAAANVARADAIHKWRTPAGSLYFGDHAPAGSILLETIADTARPPPPPAAVESDLARAAADGREIMRRRSAERAEERRLESERAARLEALGAGEQWDGVGLPFLIVDSFPQCRVGEPCFRGRRLHRFGSGFGHGLRHGAHPPFFRPLFGAPARPAAPPRGGRLMGTGRSPRQGAG